MELVAYFSPTGTTKKLALELAKKKKADLYEIEPETPYTKDDLNYMDEKARSTVEMHNLDFRPPIKNNDPHIEKYSKIYIGFPIWWYIAPTIINTFLEKYDFSDKEVVLFATSGSSGFGDTIKSIEKSAKCKVTCGQVNSIDGI